MYPTCMCLTLFPQEKKGNITEKQRDISPLGFQEGKPTRTTVKFPTHTEVCLQDWWHHQSCSCWGFHTVLQQWISSGDVCQTVVSWQICPMATWWTCSVPTTPRAPQFLLPWRESTHSHRSPRSLPLLAPASSAPSPVPWSKPHKQLQDWLITRQVPHHLWLRNLRSSWLLMMHIQSGKSSELSLCLQLHHVLGDEMDLGGTGHLLGNT